MDETLIFCKNLYLGYGHHFLLNDFSAEIYAGEFIGILGPNGAGKSTFLKAILGLKSPSKGTLRVLNSTIHKGHPFIGYLPQARNITSFFNFTAKAWLASTYKGNAFGIPFLNKKEEERLLEILALVEGVHLVEMPFFQLSGGEKQRLLLAQALLDDPKILLLDEPLNNLDPHYQEIIIELVQKISKQMKVTVLFTAHDVNPLLGVMNRVLYMARGKAVLGKVDEVVTTENLSALYGAPMEVIHYDNKVFVVSQKHGISELCQHCEES